MVCKQQNQLRPSVDILNSFARVVILLLRANLLVNIKSSHQFFFSSEASVGVIVSINWKRLNVIKSESFHLHLLKRKKINDVKIFEKSLPIEAKMTVKGQTTLVVFWNKSLNNLKWLHV